MHRPTSANGTARLTDWNAINWKSADRNVRNLRQRIYRAEQAGDHKKVRSLQKLMLRSYSNTLMAVRRVTQLNQGKQTAGVDKLVVKTPEARGKLVDRLMTYQPWRAKPARRVYIPKANGKLRPLGIPSVIDRCLQAKVKNALEPDWEARFEGSSYGFRPGRSCQDAIAKVYLLARPHLRKKWIVDADIQGAFDNIGHAHLLETIGPCPGRELIKQWLKAGYLEKGVFHETPHGTPQGGVISPLLANIALHGMEEALGVKHDGQGRIRSPRASVRYADDFVVFCESKEDAEVGIQTLTSWLSQRGLTLSAEKTRIVHLSEGFDFLGFNVRHYPAPKTSRSGYKLLIKPSKSSVQKLRDKLRDTWRKWQGTSVEAVIQQLNPIIRGWANYFRSGVTSETFGKLDAYQFQREVRYAKRGHPNKPWHWIKTRYWGRWNPARQDHWVFGNKHTGHYLLKFAWFKIERHVLVKGTASPDDPNLRSYWLSREKATAKTLSPKWRRLAEKQGHVCGLCGASLFNGEELQLHHRKPRARGGEDIESNFVLVHLYCHQQIHSAGGRKIAKPGDERLLL